MKEEAPQRCEFCGKEIENSKITKYCSKQHQQTAARRRVARRLEIPPKINKLNQLYFN
jgi:hypothetical protein